MIGVHGVPLVSIALLISLVSCSERPPSETPEPAPPIADQNVSDRLPVTLEGGLVLHDVSVGRGPQAAPSDHVEVEFVARFASGEVWDSTEKRNRTLTLDLANPALIEGLRRGIPGMRVGGVRRIDIPWMLAYGASGRDPVPSRTDLSYDITLIAIHDSPRTGRVDAPDR